MPKRLLLIQCMSFILLCVLLAFVWNVGPELTIADKTPLASALNRAIVNTILIVIWLFSIVSKSSANGHLATYSPKTRAALTVLNRRFQGAIQFLKRTTISPQNSKSTKNLADLPWYLVMGPPGAGKTTLLAKANLPYILTKQSKQHDSGNTVNATDLCDWWVSRRAVFLDTTGEFCPVGRRKLHYKTLWQHLLRLIKQQGNARLNGIILVLDLPRTAKLPRNKQAMLYHNIRANLNAVYKQLRMHVPVYLVCNQCDRILGFQEFFADLGADEQQQIWGATLDSAHLINQRALLSVAKQELSALLTRLHERLLWRLHHERNSQKRLLIKDFPVQLEMLCKQLTPIIKHITSLNNMPWLRGFYFISSIQQHDLEDYLLLTIQKNLDLPSLSHLPLLNRQAGASNAFFSRHFLQKLLIQDQQLIQHHAPNHFAIVWYRRIAIACVSAVVITCAILWSTQLHSHIKQVDTAEKALAKYKALAMVIEKPIAAMTLSSDAAINQQRMRDEINIILPALQAAAQAVAAIDDTQRSWLTQLLDKQSNQTYANANTLYQQALQQLFAPAIRRIVESQLADGMQDTPQAFYSSLEVYLMLGQPQHLSQQLITTWLSHYWQQLFPENTRLQQQLAGYTDDWLAGNMQAIALNDNLLSYAKEQIAESHRQQAVIANPIIETTKTAAHV